MRALTTISDLLDKKGRDVFTIQASASIAECSQAMSDKRVSSLVVLDGDNKLVGIITSRDIVLVTAKGGSRVDSTQVRAVMAESPRTVEDSEGVEAVEQMMIENRIRHLLVMKDGELTGLITRIDLLRHYLDRQQGLSSELEAYISGAYPR